MKKEIHIPFNIHMYNVHTKVKIKERKKKTFRMSYIQQHFYQFNYNLHCIYEYSICFKLHFFLLLYFYVHISFIGNERKRFELTFLMDML